LPTAEGGKEKMEDPSETARQRKKRKGRSVCATRISKTLIEEKSE